jgi:glutamyl-tRNA synthetase
LDQEIENTIRRYACDNALKHEGKARPKAVLSKLLAERKDLRPRAKEIIPAVEKIVDEINALSDDKKREILEELGGAFESEVETREGLPPLENTGEKVVMRFAPGPSGPLHLGHSRAAILNDEYCKMYKGSLINRMEDTDPHRILPEAYDWIPEDLEWLGVKVHQTVVQSERFDIYYRHARELLENGQAYVCTCDPEGWRQLKNSKKACPHRDIDPSKQLDEWEGMLSGRYAEQEATVVVKTDLMDPNPALRDWVALRIVDDPPHPKTGDRYRVYPLMNFSVAIDDHLLGLTHVLRGKDHLNNTYRQRYIYDYLDWQIPEYIHYGRVKIEGPELSSSRMLEGISKGEFDDWDDVRLGTIRAFARRGFRPEAIRRYWVEAGPKPVDIELSWNTVFAYNKDIVDPGADRYFFVWNGRPLEVTGTGDLKGRAPVHPDDPSRGFREVEVRAVDDKIKVLVVTDDLEKASRGDILRLKDLCNIRMTGEGESEYAGNDLSVLKKGARIIHWVHPEENVDATVHMPDGKLLEGKCEAMTTRGAGKVIQFERFGFTRIVVENSKVIGYYAHR